MSSRLAFDDGSRILLRPWPTSGKRPDLLLEAEAEAPSEELDGKLDSFFGGTKKSRCSGRGIAAEAPAALKKKRKMRRNCPGPGW